MAKRPNPGWLRDAYSLVETSAAVLAEATDLAVQQFGIWDAGLLSAAAESGCRLLLSEDMQDGFIWKGVTVVNRSEMCGISLLAALLV